MYLGIDTETTGLDLHKHDAPFAVSMCDETGKDFYWEWDVDINTRRTNPPSSVRKEILEVIRSYRRYVFTNSTFDLWALEKIGIKFPWQGRVEDTICTSHVLFSSEKKGLKNRALIDLEIDDIDEKELHDATVAARRWAKKLGWESFSTDNAVAQDYWMPRAIFRRLQQTDGGNVPESWDTVCSRYAKLDAARSIALFFRHKDWLLQAGLYEQYDKERRLIPVVYRMKRRGVNLLFDRLKKEKARYQEESDAFKAKATKLFDININSDNQLRELLFEQHDVCPVIKTDKGNPSVSKEALDHILSDTSLPRKVKRFLENLMEYRIRDKAVSYLENYAKHASSNEKVHPGYQQNGTTTTRFSCKDPNTTNVSKGKEFDDDDGERKSDFKLRSVFGPGRRRIWYPMDYSQLQLRIFASVSGEQSMLDAFEAGYDFHAFVASKIFQCDVDAVSSLQRRVGKNVNFGFIFGAQPAKIERTAGRPGLWEVVTKQFPNAHNFMQQTQRTVRKLGYITTPGGRRLQVEKRKAYKGVVFIVQGCEGEIVKDAMVGVDNYFEDLRKQKRFGTSYPFITMQVHDEIVPDFPRQKKHPVVELKKTKQIMESSGAKLGIHTPVDIEVVEDNWAESEKLCL